MKVRNKILSIAAGTFIGMSVSGVAQAAGWTEFDFVNRVAIGAVSIRVQLENHQSIDECPRGAWYALNESSATDSKKVLAMALLAKATPDQQVRIYVDGCVYGYQKLKYIELK